VLIHDAAPVEVDYCLADDPYLSKYRLEGQMAELKKLVTLSGNVCIMEMIEHIYNESELLFKETIHEKD
jgi:hypothetical protein